MATIATMEEAYLQSRPPMTEGAAKVPGMLVKNGTYQVSYLVPEPLRSAVLGLNELRACALG